MSSITLQCSSIAVLRIGLFSLLLLHFSCSLKFASSVRLGLAHISTQQPIVCTMLVDFPVVKWNFYAGLTWDLSSRNKMEGYLRASMFPFFSLLVFISPSSGSFIPFLCILVILFDSYTQPCQINDDGLFCLSKCCTTIWSLYGLQSRSADRSTHKPSNFHFVDPGTTRKHRILHSCSCATDWFLKFRVVGGA